VDGATRRAVGVEYSQDGAVHRAKARREVLLAGGSIASPQLMQVSGIGPGELLQSLGIAVAHELRGVGENLQDHIGARVIYRCRNANTLNEVYHSLTMQARAGFDWIVMRRGPLMMGAAPMGLFVKTRPELVSPDVQYQFLAGSSEFSGGPMHKFPACTMVTIPCRPESRGWLRIRSPEMGVAPAINPNYLATRADRETVVAGVKVARRVFQTKAMGRLVSEEFWPGPAAQSDEDLLEHVRNTGGTTFHPTSTCMMGSHPLAVVDATLKVHGMTGLRVVDASIMPTVLSGNTNAGVIMIAEKASDMVLAEARTAA
jgi:choline dehydrogenase